MDEGTVYKRCYCRDGDTGRVLGAACPQLRKPRHGSWAYQFRLEPGGRQYRRGGFKSQTDAHQAMQQARVELGRTSVDAAEASLSAREWLLFWLAEKEQRGGASAAGRKVAATTARGYRAHLELYLIPALGLIASEGGESAATLRCCRPVPPDDGTRSHAQQRGQRLAAPRVARLRGTLKVRDGGGSPVSAEHADAAASGIWPILSDDGLTGPWVVRRLLRPQTVAQVVAMGDYDSAKQAVLRACGSWAGAYSMLLPAERGMDLASPWRELLSESQIDSTYTGGVIPAPELGRRHSAGGGFWYDDEGRGDSLLSVLARAPQADKGWTDIQTADGVPDDDPWSLAYTAVLGHIPTVVDDEDLRRHSLRDGLTYSELLTILPVTSPTGAEDLLSRLRTNAAVPAVELTNILLTRQGALLGRQWDTKIRLEPRWQYAADVGPNVVVVYEPGSVQDLALLWHLRAVHALPPGFPLAVPSTVDVGEALRVWEREHAMRLWGFRGLQCVLTSFSVPLGELEAVAQQTQHFSVTEPDPLMRPLAGCGLQSSEVAYFENGSARLSSFAPTDRATLGSSNIDEHGNWMRLRVVVPGRRLPDSRTMRAAAPVESFHEGPEVKVSARQDSVAVQYPTGMDVLHAVLKDHGLRGQPSAPGLAAEHFARVLQGTDALTYLGSPAALASIQLLTRRQGMSTLRRRLNSFLAPEIIDSEVAQDRVAVLERRLDEALETPGVQDLPGVSLQELRSIFNDRDAAEGWMRWALSKRLVLRGVKARCHACALRQWRQLAETLPVLICQGCGVEVDEPFRLDAAHFSYRASELLLRMLDADILSHLLSLRFFSRLFDGGTEFDGMVYGGYPGLEVRRVGETSLLAEFDVVLVLADGRLILGECKTSARGLSEGGLERLWGLGEEFGAAMTFVATLDRAAVCPPIWRTGLDRNHVALTAEHLFDPHPIALLNGPEPLDWRNQFVSLAEGEITDDAFNAQVNQAIRDRQSGARAWREPRWRTEK